MSGVSAAMLVAAFFAQDSIPSYTALIDQARAAFESGVQAHQGPEQARSQFFKAAQAYTELTRRGHRSAPLYRNQGNAWLLAGDLPRAILSYRKGMDLDPSDSSLRACLDYARSLVVYHQRENLGRPVSDTLISAVRKRFPPAGSFCSALVLYTLGCLGLAYWKFVRTSRALYAASLLLVGAAIIAWILTLQAWTFRDAQEHPVAVVSQDGVILRKGNGSSYPTRTDTPVNRGVEAKVLYTRDDWLQIELLTGEVGWVPRQAALVDF